MTDKMEIWKALGTTDPKHTKKFTRAGGFSGDAIKPMYAIQKMTERFGACGTGWGYTQPDYRIVAGTEGQKLIYCTIGLWYGEKPNADNAYSYPYVYGVGGDFIIVKQKTGLRSDDEAFKKAFTDALMNAMKHIGMSADVHMGQFDGSKYHAEDAPEPVAAPKPEPIVQARKKFIIQTINDAKDVETAKKLKDAAKQECEDAQDVPAWNEIYEQYKVKYKQLTTQGEN